jgi:hypothetical protein
MTSSVPPVPDWLRKIQLNCWMCTAPKNYRVVLAARRETALPRADAIGKWSQDTIEVEVCGDCARAFEDEGRLRKAVRLA